MLRVHLYVKLQGLLLAAQLIVCMTLGIDGARTDIKVNFTLPVTCHVVPARQN